MASTLLAGAALFSAVAHALVAGPMETFQPHVPFNAMSPMPTVAPVIRDELRHVLLYKRQSNSGTGTTVLVAPDNTCGYVSAVSAVSFTCASDRTCVLFTSQLGMDGFVACCNDVNCGRRTTCIDSSALASGTSCDDDCQSNASIKKCTARTAPICLSISFSGGVTDYFCASFTNGGGIVEAETTFNGQTRSFQTVDIAKLETSTSSSSSASSVSSLVSTGGVSTIITTATPTPSNESDNGTPVGPIVGGVVGGVTVTIAISIACWWILHQKKKKKLSLAKSQTVYASGGHSQRPGSAQSHQSIHYNQYHRRGHA